MKTITALFVLLLMSGCATMPGYSPGSSYGPGPMIELAATAGLVGLTIGALGERSYTPIYGGYYRHDYGRGRGFDHREYRNHRR